jgi:hypothetical protein
MLQFQLRINQFPFGIITALAVLHGPLHLQEEMHKLGLQMLHEASRTDNWGNPDIFQGRGSKSHVHATEKLSPVK